MLWSLRFLPIVKKQGFWFVKVQNRHSFFLFSFFFPLHDHNTWTGRYRFNEAECLQGVVILPVCRISEICLVRAPAIRLENCTVACLG